MRFRRTCMQRMSRLQIIANSSKPLRKTIRHQRLQIERSTADENRQKAEKARERQEALRRRKAEEEADEARKNADWENNRARVLEYLQSLKPAETHPSRSSRPWRHLRSGADNSRPVSDKILSTFTFSTFWRAEESDFYDTQPEVLSRLSLQNRLLECTAKAESGTRQNKMTKRSCLNF